MSALTIVNVHYLFLMYERVETIKRRVS